MSRMRIPGKPGDSQPDCGGDDRVAAKPEELPRGTGRLPWRAKEMSRDRDDARHAAPTRRTTAADRWRLACRSGPVACLVCRIGRRPPGARTPAPIGRGADYRADRGFDGAAGRQGERGQYRVTGA